MTRPSQITAALTSRKPGHSAAAAVEPKLLANTTGCAGRPCPRADSGGQRLEVDRARYGAHRVRWNYVLGLSKTSRSFETSGPGISGF
jgi:hypothetical protein